SACRRRSAPTGNLLVARKSSPGDGRAFRLPPAPAGLRLSTEAFAEAARMARAVVLRRRVGGRPLRWCGGHRLPVGHNRIGRRHGGPQTVGRRGGGSVAPPGFPRPGNGVGNAGLATRHGPVKPLTTGGTGIGSEESSAKGIAGKGSGGLLHKAKAPAWLM